MTKFIFAAMLLTALAGQAFAQSAGSVVPPVTSPQTTGSATQGTSATVTPAPAPATDQKDVKK